MDFKGVKVLVLDCSGRQVPTILKELHDLKCEITTLNGSKLDNGYLSRYPKHKLLYPGVDHDDTLLKEALDTEIKSGKYDVVFPMLEGSTELLWKNADEYAKYVKIAAADYEGFVNANDKQLTMELCMANGISCPRTKKDSETMEEFLADVEFPLALKPRVGSGSRGFHKAENKAQLEKLISSGQVKVPEYVIQEFIEEAETHRVSYTFIDNDNNVKVSMIAKSTRPYPLGVGTNSFFESTYNPELCEQSEKLLKLMNWHGYASVCFIESEKDGIPKVMEINGRVSASIKISYVCGINIARLNLERVLGHEVTEYSRKVPENRRIKHSQAEWMWFLKSPDRFKRKPSHFNPAHTWDVVFSWKDPMPYIGYTLQCLTKYKTEMKKRER